MSSIVDLGAVQNEELYLHEAGSRYLFTGCDCPHQAALNDFERRRGQGLAAFRAGLRNQTDTAAVLSEPHPYVD